MVGAGESVMSLNVTRKKYSVNSLWPSTDAILLMALATFVVLTFRAEFHRLLPLLGLETLFYFAIPTAALVWIVVRLSPSAEILTNRKWIWGLRSSACLLYTSDAADE